MIEEFISDKLLLSLPGCVAIVMLGTQVLKKFISFDSQKIALIISIIVAIVRIFVVGTFDLVSIFVGLLNVFPILWGSMSGYDTMIKSKANKVTTLKDEIPEIPIIPIDPNMASNSSVTQIIQPIIKNETNNNDISITNQSENVK